MTKSLTEMTVTEAASKALQVILAGEYEYRRRKFDWYDEDKSWQDSLREDYALNEDDDFSNLDSIMSAWLEARYLDGKFTDVVEGFTAECVAKYGGEGQGDQYWMVISLSDGTTTRYFRKDGWYSSYGGGGTLDGETYEVKPQERLVTFYE